MGIKELIPHNTCGIFLFSHDMRLAAMEHLLKQGTSV